jgi:predicted metal-dependent enzyme (double-stranded beta helix superfamily)
MFDLQAFIEACLRVASEPHAGKQVLDLMRAAVGDREGLKQAITPLDKSVGVLDAQPLYRSDELVVLNVTLRPRILSIPHDHRMWAVIGIYEGQENNTFYRRSGQSLAEANRRELGAGEAMLLGPDVIHAIENPLDATTLGLHVYGGDLLAASRSMWDPASGVEHPYEVAQFTRWSRELALSRRAA